MKYKFLKKRLLIYIVVAIIIFVHAILRALDDGNDINVYLFAARQFLNGDNIYTNNPYNSYLYSPLFAFILRPLIFFDLPIARVVWAILNLFLTLRIGRLLSNLVTESFAIDKSIRNWWAICVAFIALGYLNDNIILGQVTIVILWLTLEGLYKVVYRQKTIKGSLLLALGISIKIIPLIGLFYLLYKGKIKAFFACICFVYASLLLPSLFTSHTYNVSMLHNWAEAINPKSNRYVFENDDGIHSLNAILPAYFYTFNDGYEPAIKLKRQIVSIPHDRLVFIMQACRVFLLLSCTIVIFYQYRRKEKKGLYVYRELAYLTLVSSLIFPHQPYYAMLYFVPAGSYIILFILLALKQKKAISLAHKTIIVSAIILLLVVTLKGRDTLGNTVVEILNFYHFEGLVNLIFLVFIIMIKPDFLIQLNRETKNKIHGKEEIANNLPAEY